MSKETNTRSGGIGFVGLLTIVFIVLKLVPGNEVHAHWTWLWVLSPMWISLALVLVLLLFAGLGYLIYWVFWGRK